MLAIQGVLVDCIIGDVLDIDVDVIAIIVRIRQLRSVGHVGGVIDIKLSAFEYLVLPERLYVLQVLDEFALFLIGRAGLQLQHLRLLLRHEIL